MRERINSQIKEEMGKNQREYVLRQQLKAIKEELGEDDGDQGDLDEPRGAHRRRRTCRTEAEQVAKKQLKRLRNMQVGSRRVHGRAHLPRLDPRSAVARADAGQPGHRAAVRKVLDEDHYGLEKVKKRILEYLAVRKLKKDKKGPILCLIGPPGVGKTSLGKSIARALGRKFVRISLGGVHDEAAIRGHRRTYVGALPGQIIQGMKKAGDDQPGLHAGRGRQDRARLPRRPGGGAARGARSRSRTTRSPITTSRSRTTSRTSCSSRRRTSPTPSRRRSATAWRSSRSPATRGARSSPSRGGTSSPSSSRSTGSPRSSSRSPTRRSTSSSTATRARPASARSSGRSRASSAAWR